MNASDAIKNKTACIYIYINTSKTKFITKDNITEAHISINQTRIERASIPNTCASSLTNNGTMRKKSNIVLRKPESQRKCIYNSIQFNECDYQEPQLISTHKNTIREMLRILNSFVWCGHMDSNQNYIE